MASFAIQGGHRIEGTVSVSGNKNAAFPLIAASLLTDETVTLENIPQIDDVDTMLAILEGLGVFVRKEGSRLTLRADALHGHAPDPRLFGRIRGGLNLMGPLLARRGAFQVAGAAGGDDIGRRRIDTHLLVFEQLGASFARPNSGRFELTSAGRLRGADILLDEASVTATQNAVMAASLAQGTTILRNTASEPHVQELCRLLVDMGCPIEGIGSNTLVVHGQERLHGAHATIGPDYMEVGSFIGLGAITRGDAPHRPTWRRTICACLKSSSVNGWACACSCRKTPSPNSPAIRSSYPMSRRCASAPTSAARFPRSMMPPGPPFLPM